MYLDKTILNNTVIVCPYLNPFKLKGPKSREMNSSDVNFSLLQNQLNVPAEFFWPEKDVAPSDGDLDLPVIDLSGFLNGNEAETQLAAKAVREACMGHGTFLVVNHGFKSGLAEKALEISSLFFGLSKDEKLKAYRIPGNISGYTAGHSQRFSSNLPWNETLTLAFKKGPPHVVEEFLTSRLGNDRQEIGKVFQEFCEAMNGLIMDLMELLGISMGLKDRTYYRRFFEDGSGIFRCNYYPPCKQPEKALGVGPHNDPTAITVLLQDDVVGLEVFVGGRWQTVRPRPGAFVVNVGDTFMALSNGNYKSCYHRAVVNKEKVRRSLVFFSCPREDIVPPPELVESKEASRQYPDFTWAQLQKFTQSGYRVDNTTLHNFSSWLASNPDKKST
ncbi:Oxoglutarate/iron-dependent dioxygenase [Arabidopsis thaliana x Arabidopsis arenosa]|uniref:Oxoglutarate/iron-dependent dioxygenase n=1 Tax=Arabidopsis thaliana x Arabidopsis arenosa TaxID=1240361 RepID=A0A8T2C4K7_9BRAS|nr:Oxoglutarate/iron-dependent dioxygenase [Arabidopsis thaliana x Arabidopsis arenosa]